MELCVYQWIPMILIFQWLWMDTKQMGVNFNPPINFFPSLPSKTCTGYMGVTTNELKMFQII